MYADMYHVGDSEVHVLPHSAATIWVWFDFLHQQLYQCALT